MTREGVSSLKRFVAVPYLEVVRLYLGRYDHDAYGWVGSWSVGLLASIDVNGGARGK